MNLLGDVAVITDCEHKTAPACDPNVRHAWSIGTKAIRNGLIQYQQARPVDEDTYLTFAARRKPRTGDLILAREAPVGDVVQVPADQRVCLGQRTVLISPDAAALDSRYLYYLLRGPECQRWMELHSGGSTVSHLNVRDIYRIPLGTLPPVERQAEIARVLGAFDSLIQLNKGLADTLEGLLFQSVWTLAENSPTVRFGDLASRANERIVADALPSGAPYLGLEHFGTDGVGLIGRGTTDGITSTSVAFRRGDVLYGKLRPYFRKVARPGFDGTCSSEIWVLRTTGGHAQAVVHAVAQSAHFSLAAMSGSGGTKMPRADWNHLADLPAPDLRHTLGEGRQIALETLWESACELRDEAIRLGQHRDRLLPLLMSGQVRVSELEGVS